MEISDPTIQAIVTRIVERSNAGMEKYGHSLRDNKSKTLIEWINDTQEELYDAMAYLEKLKERIKEIGLVV